MTKVKRSRLDKPAILYRGSLLLGLMAVFATATLYFAGVFNGDTVTAQKFVDLQQGDEPHLGFRRAHAKGMCVSGR
ncbi:hypothetical protein OS109_25155, partial [Escherichia coli]|nr:hypothetical protein [Escherichia coli]